MFTIAISLIVTLDLVHSRTTTATLLEVEDTLTIPLNDQRMQNITF